LHVSYDLRYFSFSFYITLETESQGLCLEFVNGWEDMATWLDPWHEV
jgi:hypothetical protein